VPVTWLGLVRCSPSHLWCKDEIDVFRFTCFLFGGKYLVAPVITDLEVLTYNRSRRGVPAQDSAYICGQAREVKQQKCHKLACILQNHVIIEVTTPRKCKGQVKGQMFSTLKQVTWHHSAQDRGTAHRKGSLVPEEEAQLLDQSHCCTRCKELCGL
jgi:hypothetical protein